MLKIIYRLVYRRKLTHLEFNLRSHKLELMSSDKKYYYFKDINTRKSYRVSKLENGEELGIYENWLKS